MPTLYVQIKQLGRRAAFLEKRPVEIPPEVTTLGALLAEIVRQEVAAFRERHETAALLPYLTQASLADAAESGKVGFGAIYGEKAPDVQNAIDAVMLAFEDGLFRVFLDDEPLADLDAPQAFPEDATLTFLRLTFLAGRMW